MRELASSSSGSVVTTTLGRYAIGGALVAHPASDARSNTRGARARRAGASKLLGAIDTQSNENGTAGFDYGNAEPYKSNGPVDKIGVDACDASDGVRTDIGESLTALRDNPAGVSTGCDRVCS